MKSRRLALLAVLAAGVCSVRGFEILPLVDESDWAGHYDIERTNGMAQVLDQVMRTHPTTILWRDKGAGRSWLPVPSERTQYGEQPLDKRLIPCYGSFGYLRLDRPEFATVPKMRAECRRRGVGYGFHTGFEENHQIPTSESNWNMAHPEFACLNHAQMPRLACASLAFPEVLEHKLRLVDERLAFGPEIIFLDMHRAGGWSVDIEYVKPVCDRWRAKYRCEPPENPRDPRWIAHCSEDVMRYLRQFSARCRAKGTRFLFGIQKVQVNYDYMWDRYGIDWKTLAKEGVFDGLVVMGVKPDTSRPFESTREILSYVKANCGGTPLYWQASSYHSNNGFPDYAKWTKTDTVTAMRRMLALAKEIGCAGVILECVDPGHYADAHCALLAEAAAGKLKP